MAAVDVRSETSGPLRLLNIYMTNPLDEEYKALCYSNIGPIKQSKENDEKTHETKTVKTSLNNKSK